VLQNRFAASSIAGSASSVIASPSDGGYDEFDSEEDDEDAFVSPNAAAVTPSSTNVLSAPGDEPRVGKGPGKGKYSHGNVIEPSRNQKDDHTDNLSSKVPQKHARTFRKVIEEDDFCPVHGVICSKGICSVMKKRKREKERLEKQAVRQKGKEARQKTMEVEEGGGNGKEDREAGNDATEVEAESVAQNQAASIARSRAAVNVAGSAASTSKPWSTRKGDWGPKRSMFIVHLFKYPFILTYHRT
jgi:hypothetical protein